MKKIRNSHKILLALALLLIAGAMAGNTLAFLLDSSEDVTNTFIPGYVTTEVAESFENNVKSNVSIKNTGNTDAYIRAAVVVTWQNAQGQVYGVAPVEGEDNDYVISFNDTGWILGNDGFFYHTDSVAPGGETATLITSCSEKADKAPEGYRLCVEIIGSGIQAKGLTDNGNAVVVEEWFNAVNKLELKDGKIAVKTVSESDL